jgi:hypothetical protein
MTSVATIAGNCFMGLSSLLVARYHGQVEFVLVASEPDDGIGTPDCQTRPVKALGRLLRG